ncbi:3-deoxy-manno-octulosonate cytidylyltransferase [Gammaproteobacteria bacterium SCGC AG-212-F23]|nr:3-deoxy-manno-octulosonate cytidylyltransferase [Gammaproteobacteria bacterium SCGC AG-212-F23]
MKILCVIPSRIHSTRIARKPLLPIQGKPMIAWVYENAKRCKALTDVIVATDSEEIAEVITARGGKIVMTDPALATGSDRVAVVAKQYPDFDVVINLQGDEPFIKPRMLEQLVAPYLAGEMPEMTTLAYPLHMDTKYHEAGAVKVITDLNGNAIYFSRAPIPYFRQPGVAPVYHHMGLYAFRRDFLLHYTTLPQTPLEKIESLEQLRVLEHGFKIRVCLTEDRTLEINTPEEYEEAQKFIYSE